MGKGKLLGFSISHLRFAIQDAFFSILLKGRPAFKERTRAEAGTVATRWRPTSMLRDGHVVDVLTAVSQVGVRHWNSAKRPASLPVRPSPHCFKAHTASAREGLG
jgi:hypothetical protein